MASVTFGLSSKTIVDRHLYLFNGQMMFITVKVVCD